MFESLCLLLKSVGDFDVEPDVIVESLAKLSVEAAAVAGRELPSADPGNEERVAALEAELESCRRREAELEEELEELRSDDKAPEVFALRMRVKEQAEQIRRLTETEPLPRKVQKRPL
jgi:hypothetical protein